MVSRGRPERVALSLLEESRGHRKMQASGGNTARRAALTAALFVCALGSAGGAPAGEGVLWQGATPEHKTGLAAGIGRELLIPLEASGPLGSSTQIRVDPLPAGARLERVSEAPAQAVLRWRPSSKQLGDWTFVFNAVSGNASAPSLTVYVHVGRSASRTFRLSSVNGRSQSATLLRSVSAYARPTQSARVVSRLRAVTPEHIPHVVYLLGGTIGRDGRYWLRVQLPVLPNGSSGWIPRDAVKSFRSVDTHLVIDRARFRATLFRSGRPVFRSIIGVGEARWPTPAGRFYVRERLTGFTDPIYGAIAFGTNGRSAVLTDWPGGGYIGVHGTNQPQILPGRVSHGCVRLPNSSIRRLDRMMRVGTPVTIK
jgi:lipoprotein-anchoring transpeptidase ErfK/SrfK